MPVTHELLTTSGRAEARGKLGGGRAGEGPRRPRRASSCQCVAVGESKLLCQHTVAPGA